MLYTSHSTMVPCSSSHLSCLARGRRAWEEWQFYSCLAHEVLQEAAAQLHVARLHHGLRQWHLAASMLDQQHSWGPLSLPYHVFHAWSQLAQESSRVYAAALERASSWLRSYGWRVVVAYSFRRLRGFARTMRSLRRSTGALRHRAKKTGWVTWTAAVESRRAQQRAALSRMRAASSSLRQRLLCRGLDAWYHQRTHDPLGPSKPHPANDCLMTP